MTGEQSKQITISGTIEASYGDGRLLINAPLLSSAGEISSPSIDVEASFQDRVSILGYLGDGFVQIKLGGSFILGSAGVIKSCFAYSGIACGADGDLPAGVSTPLLPFSGGAFDISGGLVFQGMAIDSSVLSGSYSVFPTQILLYDSNMQPLVGYSLQFASDLPSAVPEPSSIGLMLSLAACTIPAMKNRRR